MIDTPSVADVGCGWSRYVVLRHEVCRALRRTSGGIDQVLGTHWDLMLERPDALRTWSMAQEIVVGVPIEARELPPHRKHYLEYEGPLSENRGHVTRVDSGFCQWLDTQTDCVRANLRGVRWSGMVTLIRDLGSDDMWSFLMRLEVPDGQSTFK